MQPETGACCGIRYVSLISVSLFVSRLFKHSEAAFSHITCAVNRNCLLGKTFDVGLLEVTSRICGNSSLAVISTA